MKETKIYADEFCTTFASTTEMLEFLAERAKQSKWIRKPTRMLKLVPLEKEAETIEEACEKELEGIVEDTEKNTQLVLKVNKDFYPVRDCAIHTILKRAGINGTGLKKLEKATYAKVVNYCLQVAKGDALIKVADGKVSAVHGGDDHDYCVLDMQTIFNMTSDYLKAHFKGSTYLEGSGSFDHSIVSAMWTLGGNQELLDTYHQALEDHGIEDKSLAPALRLTTSDVAVSGVNLYPMMLSQTSNRVINLGSPIKLSHDRGATLQDFRNNLDKIFSRYQEAVKGIVGLMDIDIQNPVNCLHLIMKELKINQKIRNEVVELFVGQYGEEPCTAHDLYFAMHEAAFFAACEGFSAPRILKLEEDIAKTLVFDWKGFDVYGSMFGTLDQYQSQALYRNYPCFYMYVPGYIYEYQIFSCYAAPTDHPAYTYDFPTSEDYEVFLETLQRSAEYNTGMTVTEEDQVVTLSTCVNTRKDYRYLVHGKLKQKIKMEE